ncbi:hypothetical protein DVDV_0504 [Desulfovibrio sp. DV]|nr:hypothetical protein DVDV_0504 [Desulfovibrio sp. DV]
MAKKDYPAFSGLFDAKTKKPATFVAGGKKCSRKPEFGNYDEMEPVC